MQETQEKDLELSKVLKRSEMQMGLAKQDCEDITCAYTGLKREAQCTKAELENIVEVTRESITNCAELKGLFKSGISTYRSQRDVAIQVLEDVLELYNGLAK